MTTKSTPTTRIERVARTKQVPLNDMRVNPKRYLSFSVIGRKDDDGEFSKKELEQIRNEIDNRLKNK